MCILMCRINTAMLGVPFKLDQQCLQYLLLCPACSSGDDDFFDTDTEDKAFGSRNDDLHANHTHGKQSPHAGGYKAGDSNSDDRWDTTQQKPATHDNSRGSNGDDNQPAEQQPSWSSPTKDQDSAPKSTPRKTSSRRRSDGGDSGSENTPQDSGSSPSTPKDTEATPADSTKGSSGTLSDPGELVIWFSLCCSSFCPGSKRHTQPATSRRHLWWWPSLQRTCVLQANPHVLQAYPHVLQAYPWHTACWQASTNAKQTRTYRPK